MSPFPGMDPYLEYPAFWSSFHTRLMVAIAEAIEPQLSPQYYVEVESRTYQSDASEDKLLIGIPDAIVFSVSAETDPERLLTQVRNTFEKAKQWERDTLSTKFGSDLSARLAFNEVDILQFKPHTTMEIVKRLQRYSLRKSSADVKGGVFEDFLSKIFRDDLGQYFTPTPVINLMVGILQPTVEDYVGDPACTKLLTETDLSSQFN